MIGFNEKQEVLNIWEISQECKRLFEKYFLLIDESKIQEAFSQALKIIFPDGEITIQDNPALPQLAASWWIMRILGQYRKLRYSGKYAVDFTCDSKGRQQGLQHLADSLVSPVLYEEQAGNVVPSIKSGRWKPEKKPQKKEVASAPEDAAFFPMIYDELLQGLTKEQKEVVARSYSRIMYMDDIQNFLRGAYRLDQAIKKSKDEWEAYCSCKQKPSDDMQEMMNNLYINLREILLPTPSSNEASDLEKEYRKQQQFDIYDNQIRYLERVARGYDSADVSCDDRIAIPSALFGFDAESILLAAVLYRQISLRNKGEYSEDYWIIPGMYQSTFGIYGNSSVMPARCFDNIAKSMKASSKEQPPKEHPIEQIASVCGFTMIKLRRSAWDAFESVNSNSDLIQPIAIPCLQESKMGCEDILSVDDAIWYLLKTEWSNMQSAENRNSYTWDGKDELGIQIHDNGGTEAYEMLIGYLGQRKKSKGCASILPQDEKDIYQLFAKTPDILSGERRERAILALKRRIVQQLVDEFSLEKSLFSNDWPVSLLASSTSWEKGALKIFFAFSCWIHSKGMEKTELIISRSELFPNSDIDEAGFPEILEKAVKAIEENDNIFRNFQNAIQKSDITLKAKRSSTGDNLSFILTRKEKIEDIPTYDWLFGDGDIPEWNCTRIEYVRQCANNCLMQFVNESCEIDSKKNSFSRKTFKRLSEYKQLLRILFAYHANEIQNAGGSGFIIWPKCNEANFEDWCYISDYKESSVENQGMTQGEVRSIVSLCEVMWNNSESFDRFLSSIEPRSGTEYEDAQRLHCKVVARFFGSNPTTDRKIKDRATLISKYNLPEKAPIFRVYLQYTKKV